MNKLKKLLNRLSVAISVIVLSLAAQVAFPFLAQHAAAGTLGNTIVRFDRMNASQATTGMVCATASSAGAGTEASVKVTFPTGYTLGIASTFTTSTTNTGWPTGATAWPGIGTATNVTGQAVTFPSSDITDTTMHCFNWINSAAVQVTASVSNTNTGTVITQTSTPTTIDTGNYTTDSLANTCGSGSQACDQIQVSASVNQSFQFSLGTTAVALGTLSTAGPTASSAINASVSTNAKSGWQMWAADLGGANAGLHSTTASYTIGYSPAAGSAVSTLTNGTEGYNVGADSTSGTCNGTTAVDAKFANGGTSFRGGGLDGTLRSLATSTSTANACLVPIHVNAEISGTTPAATDYAGTVTVVAAGNF